MVRTTRAWRCAVDVAAESSVSNPPFHPKTINDGHRAAPRTRGRLAMRTLTEKSLIMARAPCVQSPVKCRSLSRISSGSELRATSTLSQQVPSKVSLRRAVDAVPRVWSRGCSNRPSTLEKRTTRKQPANLAVECAEESLSILPDYTPTVRPPPKRC